MQRARSNRHSLGGAWLAPLAAALLCSGIASAAAEAPPTRDEYVSRLERICKPDAQATEAVMEGTRADIQASRLGAAAGKFTRAASIFGSTVERMVAVQRPPADTQRLSKWFTYLRRQESYLGLITQQLRAGQAIKAQRLTARFIHSGNLANNVVLAFGFDFCRFKFSRYG
jgi:hypothetical protein